MTTMRMNMAFLLNDFQQTVHVMYDDVSAEEFLHVQTDDEYRKTWDNAAVALDVIDIDPVYRNKSQVIYWEMQWPVSETILFVPVAISTYPQHPNSRLTQQQTSKFTETVREP